MGISTTLFWKLEEIFEISLLLALASLICCSNHDFGTLAYLWDIIIVPLTNIWSVLSSALACQCSGSSFTWWSQSYMTANTTQPGLCLLCPLHTEPIFISSMFQISNSTSFCAWLSFSDKFDLLFWLNSCRDSNWHLTMKWAGPPGDLNYAIQNLFSAV